VEAGEKVLEEGRRGSRKEGEGQRRKRNEMNSANPKVTEGHRRSKKLEEP
jgi:hypothetical protein